MEALVTVLVCCTEAETLLEVRTPESCSREVPCTKVRDAVLQTELAYIDILVNLKMRLVSVKRMTQIQNIS